MSANALLDRLLAWEEGAPRHTTESLPFPASPTTTGSCSRLYAWGAKPRPGVSPSEGPINPPAC
jgi:hypothetical protein